MVCHAYVLSDLLYTCRLSTGKTINVSLLVVITEMTQGLLKSFLKRDCWYLPIDVKVYQHRQRVIFYRGENWNDLIWGIVHKFVGSSHFKIKESFSFSCEGRHGMKKILKNGLNTTSSSVVSLVALWLKLKLNKPVSCKNKTCRNVHQCVSHHCQSDESKIYMKKIFVTNLY